MDDRPQGEHVGVSARDALNGRSSFDFVKMEGFEFVNERIRNRTDDFRPAVCSTLDLKGAADYGSAVAHDAQAHALGAALVHSQANAVVNDTEYDSSVTCSQRDANARGARVYGRVIHGLLCNTVEVRRDKGLGNHY